MIFTLIGFYFLIDGFARHDGGALIIAAMFFLLDKEF